MNTTTIPAEVLAYTEGLTRWNILLGYRGSQAHGTYVPSSDPDSIDDIDLMGVCVPPQEYYLGMKEYGSRGTVDVTVGEWDIVVYEARKMISLLSKGNPNVLSLLWLDEYFHVTQAGQLLIDQRTAFLSKQMYHSFCGYAYGQLKRMKLGEFNGYMGQKRKMLVERYGYDCKNASHCIRVLRMGIEALSTGDITVKRPDATELLEIKRGEWSLEAVQSEADRLFRHLERARDISKLPGDVDREFTNRLAVYVVQTAWRERA